jgi:hypothetical protein
MILVAVKLVSMVVRHVILMNSVRFVMKILHSLIGILLYVLVLVITASALIQQIIFVLHVLIIVMTVKMMILVILVL